MNRIYQILLFAAIIVFSSCAISKKENEHINNFLSDQTTPFIVDATIGADSLSKENLRDFELRAMQKVRDLYDYVILLHDKEISQSIKSEVRYAAMGQFLDPHQKIKPLIDEGQSDEKMSLETCLDEMVSENSDALNKITEIKVVTPLTKIDDELYAGKISLLVKNESDGFEGKNLKSVDFCLCKIEKQFGNESLDIWEVYLTRIY